MEISKNQPERIAKQIFTEMLPILTDALEENRYKRAVVSVCGASGTDTAETAAIVAAMMRHAGVSTNVIRGDHYRHRITVYNDAERRMVFRTEGMRELLVRGVYTDPLRDELAELMKTGADADASLTEAYPWLTAYHIGGDCGLRSYLGTHREVDFHELSDIIMRFKNGAEEVFLKRMGAEEASVRYETRNCRPVKVFIIEGTQSNNDHLRGVDIPVLIWGKPDTPPENPFTARIQALENELLISQAHKAKLVIGEPPLGTCL